MNDCLVLVVVIVIFCSVNLSVYKVHAVRDASSVRFLAHFVQQCLIGQELPPCCFTTVPLYYVVFFCGDFVERGEALDLETVVRVPWSPLQEEVTLVSVVEIV